MHLKVSQKCNIFDTMFVFEFDDGKSQSHLAKHGIDSVDAQRLWSDPRPLEIPARTEDEPRFLMIGLINEKYWSAVITHRGTIIRLISVRQSRDEEVTLYES